MTAAIGQETVGRYAAAWVEPDATARRALLDSCWADDGEYCDPASRVTGRQALSDLIGAFQDRQPGARIEPTSGVDEHDGFVRFTWRMIAADGSTASGGIDFGELDGAGRLRRIVGFFGPPPEPG